MFTDIYKGLSVAQHNVASFYFNGDPEADVTKDYPSAIEFWKMAASQNFILSQSISHVFIFLALTRMDSSCLQIWPRQGHIWTQRAGF
ncbi:hypothetical protein BC829DRAFT_158162 [Chytridium lagenaria]|nr:hypothetical protein BC829DRAFT_158162 [Chytridium lagenaria]